MEKLGIADGKASDTKAKQPRGPRSLRRRPGASLAEMLIAIVVLAVVLISMLGMFLISRTAIYSKEDETANALALRYMEQLEEWNFEQFPAGPNRDITTSLDHAGASLRYDVTATSTKENPYFANVTVTVSWNSTMAGRKTVEMERFISAAGYKNVGDMLPGEED